jgi:regulatory protein
MIDSTLYEKLLRFCEYSERCKSDVVKKFVRLKQPKTEALPYLEKLEQIGVLNEKRYVKSFIHSHVTYKKWGTTKIKHALGAKGIKQEFYQEFLAAIDGEDYKETIKTLVERKLKSIKGETALERKTKLIRFLAGRGFEMGVIQKVLKEIKL